MRTTVAAGRCGRD